MLDAFQQGRSRREPLDSPALHTVWPEEGSEEAPPEEDAIPFIEVGGPRLAVESAP